MLKIFDASAFFVPTSFERKSFSSNSHIIRALPLSVNSSSSIEDISETVVVGELLSVCVLRSVLGRFL